MEALQIVKQSYLCDLRFTKHLVDDPATLEIVDDSDTQMSCKQPAVLDRLLECMGDALDEDSADDDD